eukprot:scaffold42482_cov52-Attheya_sp.AAC.3
MVNKRPGLTTMPSVSSLNYSQIFKKGDGDSSSSSQIGAAEQQSTAIAKKKAVQLSSTTNMILHVDKVDSDEHDGVLSATATCTGDLSYCEKGISAEEDHVYQDVGSSVLNFNDRSTSTVTTLDQGNMSRRPQQGRSPLDLHGMAPVPEYERDDDKKTIVVRGPLDAILATLHLHILRALLHYMKNRDWKKKVLMIFVVLTVTYIFCDFLFWGNVKVAIEAFLNWMEFHLVWGILLFLCLFILCSAVASGKDDVRAASGLTYPCFFSIFEMAVQTMLAYADVASLQLASFETLISLFKSTNVEAELMKVVELVEADYILEAMIRFPDNAALQGAASLLLGCICNYAENIKLSIATSNQYMQAIMAAFRTHVVDRPTSLTQKDYDSVIEGICTLLASLAVCEEASPALHSLGILKETFAVSANIRNSPIPPSLGLLTRNMLKNKVAVAKFFTIHIEAVSVLVAEMTRMTRKELLEWAAESLYLLSSVSKPYIDAILLTESESGGALDQIAHAMMLFSDSDRIVKHGCAFMANAYANIHHSADVDMKVASALMLMNGNAGKIHQKPIVSIRTVNEARAILQGIRMHPESSDVITHAFLAMRNFLRVSTDSTSGISETEMQSVLISTADSAVQALIAHPYSLAVLENACGALWGLSSRSPEICFAVGRAGAILSIYDAMDKFPHEQGLQENALGALASLCSMAENIEEAGLEKGVSSIIQCLETFSKEETIAEKGISVLSALSSGSYEVKVVLVQQDNSLSRIVESMYKYPSSARIVIDACSAISNLAIDPLVSQDIANQGGIDRLANAAREHSSNPIVLEKVCSAIAAVVNAVDNEILQGNDITFCVFQMRRLHIEDPGVQAKFLSVIRSLLMKDHLDSTTKTGFNMQELKSRDVCRLVLESIQKNIGHLQVQQFGMQVLWWLATDEECQKNIVRYDGISIVLNALMAHTTDVQVQKCALGTICILGREPEHKLIIAEYDGVDTLVGTMWSNMNSPEIVCMACTALANIAFNGKTHEFARITDIELEAVTSSMDEFPESEIVQSSACVFLRNSTFAPENMCIMSSCEKLPRLLRTAIANFPNECGSRVTYIVSSLGLEWDH